MKLAPLHITALFIFTSVFSFAQTEETSSPHSISIDLSVFASPIYSSSGTTTTNLFVRDSVDHGLYSNSIAELRLNYYYQFSKNIAAYSGLYLGSHPLNSYVALRDSTSSTISSSFPTTLGPYDFYDLDPIIIPYFSIPVGVRLTGKVFKNDRVNFSLGVKTNIYPKRKFKNSATYYSSAREEDITITTTTSNNSSITAGAEGDLNYQWVSKKERFNLRLGIVMDRNVSKIFNLQTTITSDSLHFPFEYTIRSADVAGYIGASFKIGK